MHISFNGIQELAIVFVHYCRAQIYATKLPPSGL